MGYRLDHNYVLCLMTISNTTEELTRHLQQIPMPLDGTCRIELKPCNYKGLRDENITERKPGWMIKVFFTTEWARDWKSPTYDACERLARQTLAKDTDGWAAWLFTPVDADTDYFGFAGHWDHMRFEHA